MPIIIEDEPSHEIYSSLFEGTTSQLSSFQKNQNNVDTNRHNDENQFCNNIIVPDNTPIHTKDYQTNMEVSSSSTKTRQGISMDCSNKGYQMLLKMGWNETNGGLGKRRQGRINPITRSIVKKDKAGLGSFPSTNQTTTIVQKQKQSCMETKARKRRRQKEELQHKKKKEKQIRIMLRSDIPDTMEHLYLNLC